MFKYLRSVIIAFIVLGFIGLGFAVHKYNIKQTELESENICENYELIAKLIDRNINPFSKFKFIKKRNTDCKVVLAINKEDALNLQKKDFCSALDASTNSVSMLISTYVHDMYDRETAAKELRVMLNLMTPYNYCPQYMDDVVTLIKIKKRFAL